MGFRTGIVGLPNVGKSTLFNALTRSSSAQSANFPFCTIEPNTGDVAVPDDRIGKLAAISGSRTTLPARTRFVDIAGLVKGSSHGEGLGNRFLASIREVDAIAHVLRCFEDEDVVHVHGKVDPLEDATIVETELMLADLDVIDRRLQRIARHVRGGDKKAILSKSLMEQARLLLVEGQPARKLDVADCDRRTWHEIGLLTAKKVMYVCNVTEHDIATGNEHTRRVHAHAQDQGMPVVTCSAAIEEQLSLLDRDEASDYLAMLGCSEPGLTRLAQTGYDLLGMITYFTTGPKETCARPVRAGTTALDAAGKVHEDFRRGFIRAETVSYAEFVKNNGYPGARAAGILRSEGKSYVVNDGDVINFLFNV